MKKILFIAALVMSAMTMMAQESVKVITRDGNVMAGTFVEGTDETCTIKCAKDIRQYVISQYGTDTIIFYLEDIHQVHMYGKIFVPHNGKLTAVDNKNNTKIDINSYDTSNTSAMPANPNEVIGQAMKTTGRVALGIGIPCLVSGAFLMILGYGDNNLGIYQRSQISTAACVLFPIGASLTIVGIPLHVHGNRIMDLNLNYTGNGVGVAMEF
jgi:hypothetical protein